MAVETETLARLFPYESRTAVIAGHRMHYVDEGSGHPVVMVHGNPTWSFYYRNLIGLVRESGRAIAMDHIGCGLSDKPGDDAYEYTLERRIDDLEALLAELVPEGPVTLALHDWGGAIGMGWAVRHPGRVARIMLFNTGAFFLPQSKPFPPALRLVRDSSLGAFLVRGCNAFSGVAARVAAKRPMPDDVRRLYTAPYDSWANRIATLRFVQDIPLRESDRAWGEIDRIQNGLSLFQETPVLIGWGEKDFVFDRHFLAEWRERFPRAEVQTCPHAGHYVLEDAWEEIEPLVRGFMERHPVRTEQA